MRADCTSPVINCKRLMKTFRLTEGIGPEAGCTGRCRVSIPGMHPGTPEGSLSLLPDVACTFAEVQCNKGSARPLSFPPIICLLLAVDSDSCRATEFAGAAGPWCHNAEGGQGLW